MNKFLTAIILMIFSSCCKEGVEINKFILSENEKESIPYLVSETTEFRYTNGFEFHLRTISRQTTLKKTEIHHCGDNYSTYENLTVKLTSEFPELYITIDIFPKEFNPFVTISINKYDFTFDITSEPDIKTITINGEKFENLYQADYFTSDTLIIRPKQVLYNKEYGIIQIIMTDNEKFSINK